MFRYAVCAHTRRAIYSLLLLLLFIFIFSAKPSLLPPAAETARTRLFADQLPPPPRARVTCTRGSVARDVVRTINYPRVSRCRQINIVPSPPRRRRHCGPANTGSDRGTAGTRASRNLHDGGGRVFFFFGDRSWTLISKVRFSNSTTRRCYFRARSALAFLKSNKL